MLTDLCELCYACYWESLGQLWVSSSHRARLYVNGSTGGTMGIGGDIGQPKLLILSGNFTKQWDLWSQFPSYFQILFWILTQISIRFKIVGVSKVVLLKISKKWWRLWLSIINFISPDLKTWNNCELNAKLTMLMLTPKRPGQGLWSNLNKTKNSSMRMEIMNYYFT